MARAAVRADRTQRRSRQRVLQDPSRARRRARHAGGALIPASVDTWFSALEARHLADLTPSEAARALRALSSCYVERRAKLAHGGALDSAGKRAAFALFYGPLHFFVVREIVRATEGAAGVVHVLDLGCGTGAAGAAWALEQRRCTIEGIDRHPWAVAEANWTYATLGLTGHARRGRIDRLPIRHRPGQGILAAYAVNELADAARAAVLPELLEARAKGSRILVVEPIARRAASWWTAWARAFVEAGGRADEWRFAVTLPERQRQLAHAAGLRPHELTARSLWLQ